MEGSSEEQIDIDRELLDGVLQRTVIESNKSISSNLKMDFKIEFSILLLRFLK